METIGAHKDVAAFFPAIGKANRDAGIVRVETDASGAAVKNIGVNQFGQLFQEVPSMDADIYRRSQLPLQHGEGRYSQHIPAPTAHLEPRHDGTGCERTVRRPYFSQGFGGINPERQASADFAQPLCLLQNHRFNTDPTERNGGRKSPNPSPNDDDLHLKKMNLHFTI
jgi:hypothetical protein